MLLNLDVLLNIIYLFKYSHWNIRHGSERERTSSLLRIASTCKTLFSIAIPVLWQRQFFLAPIFGLIGITSETTAQLVSVCIPIFVCCDLSHFLFRKARRRIRSLISSAESTHTRHTYWSSIYSIQKALESQPCSTPLSILRTEVPCIPTFVSFDGVYLRRSAFCRRA